MPLRAPVQFFQLVTPINQPDIEPVELDAEQDVGEAQEPSYGFHNSTIRLKLDPVTGFAAQAILTRGLFRLNTHWL